MDTWAKIKALSWVDSVTDKDVFGYRTVYADDGEYGIVTVHFFPSDGTTKIVPWDDCEHCGRMAARLQEALA